MMRSGGAAPGSGVTVPFGVSSVVIHQSLCRPLIIGSRASPSSKSSISAVGSIGPICAEQSRFSAFGAPPEPDGVGSSSESEPQPSELIAHVAHAKTLNQSLFITTLPPVLKQNRKADR